MAGQASTHTEPVGDRLARVGGSPGLVLAAGALSILIGVLVLAWPGATIKVIAWLFAIQLLVAGVLQLVSAFSADRGPGGRVLFVLLGALSILVGLLCLREPLQTALVLGLLIGAVWVIQGVVGVVDAVGNERGEGRGWMLASAVLSIIGGVIVLVYPGASLVVLTWLFGIVLIVVGILLVAHGVTARRAATPAPAAAHS
jgi:uncharacterized membrane protein HdeD (DUF308 family)